MKAGSRVQVGVFMDLKFISKTILFLALIAFIFLISISTVSADQANLTPTVKNSHLIIIPDEIIIEVLSFNESGNFSKLTVELPENAKLINVSGSVNYSSAETKGNSLILQKVTITNGSHLALEYSTQGEFFSKKITLKTQKLLVLIPSAYEVVQKSENLAYRGKAVLGQNNYSIFEARNLHPGDQIELRFEKLKSVQQPVPAQGNFNPFLLGGVLLIAAGIILFIFSRGSGGWSVGKGKKEEIKEKEESSVGKERVEEKREKERKKKGKGWEI